MRFVYCIAFRDGEFLMVFNPKRAGWEMPGGKVEPGESDLDAIKREFVEETGHLFTPCGSMELEDGTVYSGEVGERAGEGEMDWCLFRMLPDQLSFPKVEYLPLIEWARRVLEHRGGEEPEAASA
jgi:8-oxo-dGTP diphosphatase